MSAPRVTARNKKDAGPNTRCCSSKALCRLRIRSRALPRIGISGALSRYSKKKFGVSISPDVVRRIVRARVQPGRAAWDPCSET
jgi:hypothetical protein